MKKVSRIDRKRRRKTTQIIRVTVLILLAVLLVVSVICLALKLGDVDGPVSGTVGTGGTDTTTGDDAGSTGETPDGGATEGTVEETTPAEEVWAEVTEKADLMAMQYDYDGAIELLKGQTGYGESSYLKDKVDAYTAMKNSCVEYKPEDVAHVFTHSLVVDVERAFDGDSREAAYDDDMLTLDEFEKIIASMYENGYVLVSLHDMVDVAADGTMTKKSIWLPEGKKPVVFSQDDLSYYHIYDGDGLADCLFVDENGEVKNKYTDANGNVLVGDYDMVPVIDTFVKEHPDFSYRGRKGIIAMTGYNGVFGYRTDGDYRDWTDLLTDQRLWLENHPEFDWEADVAAAKAVADAMKANGWEFASHSWGHANMGTSTMARIKTDTEKWKLYVESIVGKTDVFIYAYGADISSSAPYTMDNERFAYLKSQGFNIFCNVDGTTLGWLQAGENFMRQSRLNLDGHRMRTSPQLLSVLFDVEEVYNNARPMGLEDE